MARKKKRHPKAGGPQSPWRKRGGWPPVLEIPEDARVTGVGYENLPPPGSGSENPVWLPPYEAEPDYQTEP